MTVFPTQYSTLSSSALKDYIQEKYGFEIESFKYLLRGVNDHYLVETKDLKYIFRVYRNTHRSLDEIRSEVAFLNALKEKGISVSYPVSDLNHGQILEFNAAEGLRYGVLFSYAEGKAIAELSDIHLDNLGKELAGIHCISSVIELPYERRSYDMNTLFHQPIKSIRTVFKDNPEAYAWLEETKDRIVKKLESYDLSAFSSGYCHYDLLPKNFHFDDDNQITFFDFDFLGKGYLANDLMTFWVHFALNVTLQRMSQEEADRAFDLFIASYKEIKPVSDDEIAAIPYLSFGFWIFFMAYHQDHFDDFSNPFFNTRFINDRVELIKKLTNKYCQF
jgi:Ser/Thr protein kinase RdoA (MazF antagonist)